jgi:hypothetical protein
MRCQHAACNNSAVVWKYGMAQHYQEQHPEDDVPTIYTVSAAEEKKLTKYCRL